MSLTNPNTPVSQQDLQDFYHKLLPYMGGSFGMIANKFSKGDMYSTDEKMIGQWIDGKPLYQRTVSVGTITLGTTKTVDYSDWNLSELINVFGCGMLYYNSENQGRAVIPAKSTNATYTYEVTMKANMANTALAIYSSSGKGASSILDVYVTIQYTKTTDSAISIGDDTDYSTEEKIVGTWIDGSPIFQRTVQMTLPAKDSDITLNVSSWNINLVVSCQGTSASMQSAPMTTYVGNSNYHYHCFVNMPNKLLYVRNLGSTLGVGGVGYVTVQYTKTIT